jgi:hypothetical protein
VRGNSWMRSVRLLAIAFTALAIYRLLSHATFTQSPVIGNVVCAVIAWTVYALWMNHARKRAFRSGGTARQ